MLLAVVLVLELVIVIVAALLGFLFGQFGHASRFVPYIRFAEFGTVFSLCLSFAVFFAAAFQAVGVVSWRVPVVAVLLFLQYGVFAALMMGGWGLVVFVTAFCTSRALGVPHTEKEQRAGHYRNMKSIVDSLPYFKGSLDPEAENAVAKRYRRCERIIGPIARSIFSDPQ